LGNALISLWLHKNETKRSVDRTWKIKRNAKLPRHSKSLFPNLRVASPLRVHPAERSFFLLPKELSINISQVQGVFFNPDSSSGLQTK
jgi:hypothetical protein